MDLDAADALDQLVDAAHDGIFGQFGNVVEQVHFLLREEPGLIGVL